MRIFLSYAGEHRSKADAIALRLRQAGHSVFLDRDALPPAESYDERIRRAIDASDVFVFLVSPESVTSGAYALTELEFARRRWEDPSGKVLPVMIADTDYAQIPAYLRAVTVLEPQGNVEAETAAAVAGLVRNRRHLKVVTVLAAGFVIAVVLSIQLLENRDHKKVIDREERNLGNAPISVNGSSTVSRAGGGQYEMAKKPVGEDIVKARSPDFQPQERPVSVEADSVSKAHFALAALPGTVAGTVTDHFGKGLAGVRVKVLYAAGAETRTGPRGAFVFTGVPVGDHTITAEYAGYRTAHTRVSVSEKKTAAIAFVLTPTTGVIAGRVTDLEGRSLGNVSISVYGRSTVSRTGDGRYEFASIPVGEHIVTAQRPGYQPQRRPITVETDNVSEAPFSMNPLPGTIESRVAD